MKKVKRHVLAEGYVGEWMLETEGRSFATYYGGYTHFNGLVYLRSRSIAGVKRRKGCHAVRVRVVLEVL